MESETGDRKRWLVLFLTMLMPLGSYYSFDVVSPLHDHLRSEFTKSSVLDSDDFEVVYNLMFTGTSPNSHLLHTFSNTNQHNNSVLDSEHRSTFLYWLSRGSHRSASYFDRFDNDFGDWTSHSLFGCKCQEYGVDDCGKNRLWARW